MRWLLAAVALCSVVVIAASAKRVMDVLSWFAPERTEDPAPAAASTPYAVDPASPSLPAVPRPLRSAEKVLGESSSRSASDFQDSLEEAFRAAERARADLANPGKQVDQVAKQLAPDLAVEVRGRATDKVDPNSEISRELLDTYGEQKKILAGQRESIDSVLKDTTRQ